MLKNKYGFQVNISLSIFFIAFCDLFTDFPSYECHFHKDYAIQESRRKPVRITYLPNILVKVYKFYKRYS
jgi:hypothetical protein